MGFGYAARMPSAFVHQILNHYTSPQALDPGFLVLDNSSNERPDWYEYWPIRKYLINEPLDEAAFYGFLSPKFKLKTNLGADAVLKAARAADPSVDVILFSPSIHNSAYHWNVFDHGESEHPGLKAVAAEFFARIGQATDLDAMVSDSRNTVNSNFFLARPRFWHEWLALNEALYAIAGAPADALGEKLRARVAYRGRRDVQMKIFIMERTTTWILARDRRFHAIARDPFAAAARIYKLPLAVVCDALKIAYATQGRGQYKDLFCMVRGLRTVFNPQVRLGGFLRFRKVRPYLRILAAYWSSGE